MPSTQQEAHAIHRIHLTNDRLGFGDYRNALQEHEDGCRRETTILASGLPQLTSTGTVVVVLPTVSFAFSLLTMRNAGQTADNAERGKIAAESREKGIYDGVQETTER